MADGVPIGRGATMIGRLVSAALVLLAAVGVAAAQQPEAAAAGAGTGVQQQQPAGAAAFGQIGQTIDALAAAWPAQEDESVVPEAARPLIRDLKRQALAIVQIGLDGCSGCGMDERSLDRSVAAEFVNRGVRFSGADASATRGTLRGAKIERRGNQNVVVATISVAVPFGADDAVYFFERGDAGFKLVAAVSADGYDHVSGAQSVYGLQVSPSDAEGKWFAALVTVYPKAAGAAWFTPRIRIVRPAADPFAPTTLLDNDKESLYAQGKFNLAVASDNVALRFEAGDYWNAGFTRRKTLVYHVGADGAARLGPLAPNAAGFVQEWLNLSAADAARWCASDPAAAEAWRAKLGVPGVYANLVKDEGCGGRRTLVEVSVDASGADLDAAARGALGHGLFFLVEKSGDDFRMLQVGRERPADCK